MGFRFCKAPVEIRENGLICRDTVKNEEGKFVQVEGSEAFYPHTGVIVSVSQGSESNLVKTTTGIETNQKGLLTVSEDGSTTREACLPAAMPLWVPAPWSRLWPLPSRWPNPWTST